MMEYASDASTSKDIPKHPDMQLPNVGHEGAGYEEAEHEGMQDPDAGSVEGEHRYEDGGNAHMPDMQLPNVGQAGAGHEEAEHEDMQDPDAGIAEGDHKEEDEGHAKMPDINDGMSEEEQEEMRHGAIGPDVGDVAPMHDYESKKAANTKRVQEWRQRKREEAKAIALQDLSAAHGMEQAQAILNKRASTAARVRACRARKA